MKQITSTDAQERTSPRLLAKNAALNLASEAWGFIVLVLAIPAVLGALGESAFGLFSLAWVTIGYLTVFDIGVSRAATKFASEHLATDDIDGMRRVIRTALISNAALGTAVAVAVIMAGPVLVRYAFRLPPSFERDARWVVYAIGAAVPILLVQAVVRGILSSYQRFDWINSTNAAILTFQWAAAWLLARVGFSVVIVVLSTVGIRLIGTIVFVVMLLRLFPTIEWRAGVDFKSLARLYHFGSWVTVSQLVSPLLMYLDRLFIGFFLSLAAVSLYTIPCEAIFRLRVIPLSVASTLFPAFSEGHAIEENLLLRNLYRRSIHYLFLLLLPGVIFFVVMGRDLLAVWLGASFSNSTTSVLQILAFGVLVNGLANIPYNALQALGRPNVTAKLHLLELPLYLCMCLALIPHWGIAGAAIANTMRVSIDAALLFWAADTYFALRPAYKELGLGFALGLLLMATLIIENIYFGSPLYRLSTGACAMAAYFASVWMLVFDHAERPAFLRLMRFS